jgi:hypothetical protein
VFVCGKYFQASLHFLGTRNSLAGVFVSDKYFQEFAGQVESLTAKAIKLPPLLKLLQDRLVCLFLASIFRLVLYLRVRQRVHVSKL